MSSAGIATLPGETVIDTAQRIGCESFYANYLQNPSLETIIAYNLCLAENKITGLGVDAGHWIWDTLDGLWKEFESLFSGAGSYVHKQAAQLLATAQGAAKSVLNDAETAVTGLWGKTKDFLNWLDGQAAHVLDWGKGLGEWVLVALGLWAIVELAPALTNLTERRH